FDASEHLGMVGVLVSEHNGRQITVGHLGEEGLPVFGHLRAGVDEDRRGVILAGEHVGVRSGQGHRAGIVRTDSHESSFSSSVASPSSSPLKDRKPGFWSLSVSPTATARSRRLPLLWGSLPVWMTTFQSPSSSMISGR